MARHVPVHELASLPYKDGLKPFSIGQEIVTPETAKNLRASCHYERQRKLNIDQIRRLAHEMSNGWFLAGTPIWFCVLPDKSMLIVNGNHTLEAVVESGVSIPLTFIYQKVSTMDEVASVYACFDIQRVRTWMQAATAAGLTDNVPNAGNVLAGLTHIMRDFDVSNPSHNAAARSRPTKFRLFKEYTKAAHLIAECLAGAPAMNAQIVRRGGIMAVALVTMRYQPSTAETFWREFAWDDGLRKDDPRKALLRYLMNHGTTGNSATNHNILAAASAWNAAFEGRTLDHVKPGQQVAKVAILGTPWAQGAPKVSTINKTAKVITGNRVTSRGVTEPVALYADAE